MATATLDPQLKVQLTKAFRDQFDPFRQENLFAGFGKITGTGQTTRTESNDTFSRKNITYAKLISPTHIADSARQSGCQRRIGIGRRS